MNACAMVSACLRLQCPDLFDRDAAQPAEAVVPPNLRYGAGEVYEVRPGLGEEQMGDPEAEQW